MPGYHVTFGAGRSTNGGTLLYASYLPGHYDIWVGGSPMVGFPEMPICDMEKQGRWCGTKKELCDLLAGRGANYCYGQVYRSYNTDEDGSLDLFVRNGHDTQWRYYKLHMPEMPSMDAAEQYPQPIHWYLGHRKSFRRYIASTDFEAVFTAMKAMPAMKTMKVMKVMKVMPMKIKKNMKVVKAMHAMKMKKSMKVVEAMPVMKGVKAEKRMKAIQAKK